MHWHNVAPRYQLPPVYDDDLSEKVSDRQSKAMLLRKNLLFRHPDAEVIPLNTATVPQRDMPWVEMSTSEIYKATCYVSSTTLGEDELNSCTLFSNLRSGHSYS